jgi:glycosyltransferase involved in cell wall biosynthesis
MESRRIAGTGGDIVSRPRVLIAHPYVYPSGGGNSVAAWALQALRDEYDVTLATLGPVEYEAVNRSFGTSLRPEDFRIRMPPASLLRLIRAMPTPGALLEQCVTMRWAQDLDRENRFDALVSTQNEADFGRRGLHYVHFPWAYLPRPDNEMRWYHRIPGFLVAYRNFCRSVARASDEGLRTNVSLANSEFVAGRIRDVHRVESKILYPPVPGGFPSVPWERRVEGIVALGRMHATKRWETAVEIADRVRSRGIDVSLTLISHRDDIECGARMDALAAARPWFRILYDLPRERMAGEVARHRYGLHTMQNEHFGIAPAELQRAGCIAFVHRSGGPMEIVGRRDELMFDDAAEGCERICRVVLEAAVQDELRRFAAERAECFSEKRFCTELRGYVRALLP